MLYDQGQLAVAYITAYQVGICMWGYSLGLICFNKGYIFCASYLVSVQKVIMQHCSVDRISTVYVLCCLFYGYLSKAHVKEIVYPKKENFLCPGHPRCRLVWWLVCFFMKKIALHHLLVNSSEGDVNRHPLQWMGAVRMRVQIADKNITVIHK